MTAALIVFLVLLFTGLPLYVDLGLSSFLYIFITGMKPIVVLQRITQAANSFTMIAAPFFILMGNLMNTGGVTRKLFRFANTLVGSVPGAMLGARLIKRIPERELRFLFAGVLLIAAILLVLQEIGMF